MTTALEVTVIGTPVPQGSKVANRFGNGVRDANDKKLRPWRAEVAGTVADTMEQVGWTTLDGPIDVQILFFHERPNSHYGTGRNAGILKPNAPTWKSTAPDIDKLTRSVLDSLTTARAIRDDGRIARLLVEDRYENGFIGARIIVTPLNPTPAVIPDPAADVATDPVAGPTALVHSGAAGLATVQAALL